MTDDTLEMSVAEILARCTYDLMSIGFSNEKIAAVLRARADFYGPRRPETEAAERAADAARIDALRNAENMEPNGACDQADDDPLF